MSDTNNQQQKERGFVLVTSIILIAILTILGVVSVYKSGVEIRVSKTSGDAAKALAAANAGLTQIYTYWQGAGSTDYTNLTKKITEATGTAPNYYINKYPNSLNDIGATTAAVDAWVSSSNAIVYTLDAASGTVSSGTAWGAVNKPQVAVWATSYKLSGSGEYPYKSTDQNYVSGTACSECRVVVYALGRSGSARALVRETQTAIDTKLSGASAMTNAPAYPSYNSACSGGTPPPVHDTINMNHSNATVSILEVTQAPYYIKDRANPDPAVDYPSGVAIASNTEITTSKGNSYSRSHSSMTYYPAFDQSPWLLFATHKNDGTDAVRAEISAPVASQMDSGANIQPPAGRYTTNLVRAGLLGGDDEIKFFSSPDEQLFNMDAYRWGAEEFTCQNRGDLTTAAAAHAADGVYCGKAEALRLAVQAKMLADDPSFNGAWAPVTGRLTLAEFAYNVSNAIPMFGIIRVMMPATNIGNVTCANSNITNSELFEPSSLFDNPDTSGSTLTSIPGTPGNSLGPKARIIVYGTLIYDFFEDDGDGVFEATTERLLTPFDTFDGGGYIRTEHPIYINPALPRGVLTGASADFPTAAAGGTIAEGSTSNPVNLASPTDGYFPRSEGWLGSANITDGTMQLIGLGTSAGLLGLASDLDAGTALASTDAPTLFNTNYSRLKYYYDTMVSTTRQSDKNTWPVAPFPSSGSAFNSTSFCIGVEDCGPAFPGTITNNEGDKTHLLFPDGYPHGWKVALTALDMTANEWNNIFAGLSTLAGKHSTPYDPSAGTRGSPFSASDPGLAKASTLQSVAYKYFNVTVGAGGRPLLDDKFADFPALMYTAGLLGIYHHSNISGVLYSAAPVQIEPGSNSGWSYTNGAIISGGGWYLRRDGEVVVVYGPQTIDNANTTQTRMIPRRYAWQGL